MAANELNSTALVPMPPHFREVRQLGRLPTPLSDRNVLVDEIVQIKHDMKVMQLEARRIEDDMRHRLSGVDARLHAGEASARALDKREADHNDGAQQQRREADARHKEVLDEMLRFRRDTEADLRGLNQETRNEIRERDAHVQQLDALARTLTGRLKALEEDRASLMDRVTVEMDRRLKLVQDDSKRQQQQSLERLMLLERIIQRETDERTKGDIEVRQELSQVLLAVKAVSKQEATHRLDLQRELRAEVQTASKALQEQARATHDNVQLAQIRVQDQLQEEKMLREESSRSVQRQVEAFLRNNQDERQRLAKTVHDAVTHMSERTASAQTISKRLQEESSEVKRLAQRVQEQAAFGLKNLAEKVEEGLRSLRATQDRQGSQFVDVKEDLLNSLTQQREKIVAIEGRVQSEMTRNVTEERAARESTMTRLRDCEELQRRLERKVWNKYTQLEDTTTKAVENIKKDGEAARGKLLVATADLRTEVYDQRQKLQALEVQTDLKVSKQLNDLRTAHARVEVSVDDCKARVADMGRLVDASIAGQAQRLAAVETTLRDHVEQTLRDKESDVFRHASIVIQHANVGRSSVDGTLVAAAPEETHTDLSFLDLHVEPPISNKEAPLKKLEFKDLAPPPRPPSAAFVRKSPQKFAAVPPKVEVESAEKQKEGKQTEGGVVDGELAEELAMDGKQEEGAVEAVEAGDKVGEDSMGGYGDDSMEADSPHQGAGDERGEESFHDSYDGGVEDGREGDADELPPEGGGHSNGADGQARDAAATRIQARARGARDRQRVQAIRDENTAGAGGGAEVEGARQRGAEDVGKDGGAEVSEEVSERPEAERAESKEKVKSDRDRAIELYKELDKISGEKDGARGEEEEEEEEEGDAPVQSDQERAQMEALEPDVRAVINKARLGRSKDFRELISKDSSLLSRAVDSSGNTLFHIAAANGKKKIVKELLRQGDKIDIYARNNKGQNALDCALQFSFHELAEYLKAKHPKLAHLPPDDPSGEGAGTRQDLDTLSWQGPAAGAAARMVFTSPPEVGAEEKGKAAGVAAGAGAVDGKELSAKEGGKTARPGVEAETGTAGASWGAADTAPAEKRTGVDNAPGEEAKQNSDESAPVQASARGAPAGETSQGAEAEAEAEARLAASSAAGKAVPDPPGNVATMNTAGAKAESAGGRVDGGTSSAAVELSESVEELAATGAEAGVGEKAKDAAPFVVDDDVKGVPLTPPKDKKGGGAGTGGGGMTEGIEEDIVDSPTPEPVIFQTGK